MYDVKFVNLKYWFQILYENRFFNIVRCKKDQLQFFLFGFFSVVCIYALHLPTITDMTKFFSGYKKRFIGRQTSEQSLSNLTKDKISVFKTGQCQSDKSFRDRYLTNCDSVSAFKHDTSDDISQVYDLSIKRETNTENDDHKHNESIYQRRYKPVSRLTEAQRQRRRLMDRERQRRRRERIRAANLDFYQMYQY